MNAEKPEIKSLASLPSSSSGLDELLQEDASKRNYQRFLTMLKAGKNSELETEIFENPQLLDSTKAKALNLMNILILGQKIMSFHISIREPDPIIVDEIAFELVELYKIMDLEIDLYQSIKVLPSLAIYYSDYLLKEAFWNKKINLDDLKKQVLSILSDDALFNSLVDENWIAQQHRLLALYHRRQGDDKAAEAELTKYREKFQPQTGKEIRLNKIMPRKIFEAKKVLENLDQVYEEVSEIQAEVLTRSGVYQDTCFYYECADCCKKDFPTVSLTEWLHIANSGIDLIPAKARAEKIQEQYQALHGQALQIVDQTASPNQDENPENFQFTCPFLDEKDSCTIHNLRPLACRSFGLSTIDDETVQACKFYLTQYQYNASHRKERDVYDSQPHTEMLGTSNELLAKDHNLDGFKQPVGTLVAWLTKFNP